MSCAPVNNAGYTWDALLQKTSDKQWDAMLAVHQTAPFRLIRAAAPFMRDAGKKEIEAGQKPSNRCIINISSTSGCVELVVAVVFFFVIVVVVVVFF